MRRLSLALCLLSALILQAAQPKVQTKAQAKSAPAKTAQTKKLVVNDADLNFAFTTLESAIKQYNALPEAKKSKLEKRVAKAAGIQDVKSFSADARAFAAAAKTMPIATKENREVARQFLNANQKWCATVKATRVSQQAMKKLGMGGEMSLDDLVNLLPE